MLAPARYGGLERVVEAIAGGQSVRGHQVMAMVVVDPVGEEPPLALSLRRAGVDVQVLRIPARAYLKERAFLRALLRDFEPDVMHTHGYRSDVLDRDLAQAQGIPAVSTVHGFTVGDLKNRLFQRLQRRMFRRFDGVVVVSRRLETELLAAGVDRSRIHCIPNGWAELNDRLSREQARRELGITSSEFRIGCVGRLTTEKALDVAIRSLSMLQDLPISLSIVGDGPLRGELMQLASELGVADRIQWHGAVASAGRVYPAFDIFMLSSRSEGTPMALFEAMAASVPIVATTVGGVPDVITPREAILVAPESANALANAVREIYAARDSAKERAEAARTRLTRAFGIDRWLDAYEGVYESILASAA